MLSRIELSRYLADYDKRSGMLRKFNPIPWVTQLRNFIKNLQDNASITENQKLTLQKIVNTHSMNQSVAVGQPSASADLARKILDWLNIPSLDITIKGDFDFSTLVNIFTYLRPVEIVHLMVLNKQFNVALRDDAIWGPATRLHVKLSNNRNINTVKSGWYNLFKQYHQEDYQGLKVRTRQLFDVVKIGDLEVLKLLEIEFEDLHIEDIHSDKILHHAAKCPSKKLHNYIYTNAVLPFYAIKNSIGLNKKDSSGRTILFYASMLGQIEAVNSFISAGVPVEIADDAQVTPLHLAVYYNRFDVVMALLNAGANVHALVDFGDTPIHIAADQGNLQIMSALIDAKADVNVKNHFGLSPLHMAAKNNNLDLTRVLIAAGAGVDIADNEGVTPLDIAKGLDHREVYDAIAEAIESNEPEEAETQHKNGPKVMRRIMN